MHKKTMNCRIATLYLTNKPIHIYRTQYLFTCVSNKTVNVNKIAKFIVINFFIWDKQLLGFLIFNCTTFLSTVLTLNDNPMILYIFRILYFCYCVLLSVMYKH